MLHLVSPRLDSPKCVVVMITFHTYHWTAQILPQLKRYSRLPLLIVDNNPGINDSPERRNSYNVTSCYNASGKWDGFCEPEKQLIRKQNAIVITTPWCMEHGRAVDFAAKWAIEKGFDVMIHIEPDCVIWNSQWIPTLLAELKQDKWVASGKRYPSGELHPTPSAWRLDVWNYLGLSFVTFKRTIELLEPKFHELINVRKMVAVHRDFWDTAFYAAYRCARRNRASYVTCPGFAHKFRGSITQRKGLGFTLLLL